LFPRTQPPKGAPKKRIPFRHTQCYEQPLKRTSFFFFPIVDVGGGRGGRRGVAQGNLFFVPRFSALGKNFEKISHQAKPRVAPLVPGGIFFFSVTLHLKNKELWFFLPILYSRVSGELFFFFPGFFSNGLFFSPFFIPPREMKGRDFFPFFSFPPLCPPH